MSELYKKRRKKCYMCEGKEINYKDVEILKKYTNERGKILPRRVTGACAKHQRYIAGEIKKARVIGLLPFVR